MSFFYNLVFAQNDISNKQNLWSLEMGNEKDFDPEETDTLVRCPDCRKFITKAAIKNADGKCPHCGTQIAKPGDVK